MDAWKGRKPRAAGRVRDPPGREGHARSPRVLRTPGPQTPGAMALALDARARHPPAHLRVAGITRRILFRLRRTTVLTSGWWMALERKAHRDHRGAAQIGGGRSLLLGRCRKPARRPNPVPDLGFVGRGQRTPVRRNSGEGISWRLDLAKLGFGQLLAAFGLQDEAHQVVAERHHHRGPSRRGRRTGRPALGLFQGGPGDRAPRPGGCGRTGSARSPWPSPVGEGVPVVLVDEVRPAHAVEQLGVIALAVLEGLPPAGAGPRRTASARNRSSPGPCRRR